ncbi:hypothetical protein AHAT_37100 [Agarivorans sp. Toyoura001]|nr:hypothetical protein AHAT_37100 [Agarivorans sp. Toyoura001]
MVNKVQAIHKYSTFSLAYCLVNKLLFELDFSADQRQKKRYSVGINTPCPLRDNLDEKTDC